MRIAEVIFFAENPFTKKFDTTIPQAEFFVQPVFLLL